MDELNSHEPIVPALKILKEYRDDLTIAKFLSGLHAAQIRGHVLGVDMVPSLLFTFAHALCVSTGVSTSVPYQTVMMSTSRERGRGRVALQGRRRTSESNWGNKHCVHCGRSNQMSEKYWAKFEKPEWTQHSKRQQLPPPVIQPH